MREIRVSTNEAGQRLDKLLHKYLKNATTSFIYKMLRKKNIVLNDKKAEGKELLHLGDSVKMYFSEETFAIMAGTVEKKPAAFSLDAFRPRIVYEDTQLLIVNKPAGWLSQSDGSSLPSVNEYCLSYLEATGQLSDTQLLTFKPGIANRLDRNTSGLILFGKTLPALQELAALLRDRTLEKYYLAVVQGRIEAPERIDGYLLKDERTNRVCIRKQAFQDAVEIHTAYAPLKTAEMFTVLRVHLITGKTHQIRAHLSSIGHPILGDPKYGNREANAYYRRAHGVRTQLLHAYELHFPAKLGGALQSLSGKTIRAEAPKEFSNFL
ncbi:MAG TPA: RluA family pseudouridine synthase [Oribacterium sp.]|nr:RluA family pseudouridine synthase [Oribacterium sp.]HCS67106.1 RluA family pseudouridine synthase [Oribacterium sp.]